MNKVEVEFDDTLDIGIVKEIVVFNIKMVRISINDYDIKVTIKCDDKNRRCSLSAIDTLVFDKDIREVVDSWMIKNNIRSKLKGILEVKLRNNFEYKEIM